VTARVPAAADRQRIAAAEAEVAIEQLALAPLAALVLLVERRRIAEPVEQVVGRVGLAQALEATWRPAALGWRHDVALVG
jgi:hypothetical protein